MPAPQATTSIATWNRATKHVEADMRSGRYVNAETALVFVGPRGNRLDHAWAWRRVLEPARAAAGLPWVTFHTFRHT